MTAQFTLTKALRGAVPCSFPVVVLLALAVALAAAAVPMRAWAADDDICGYAYFEPMGDSSEYLLVIQKDQRPEGSGYVFLGPVKAGGYGSGGQPWYRYSSSHDESIAKVSVRGGVRPTDLSYWFRSCWNLREVDLEGLDLSVATSMKSMFSDCRSLRTASLAGKVAPNATDLSQLFYGCSSLESVDLSSFVAPQARDLSHAFQDCVELKRASFAAADFSGAVSANGAFYGCASLSEVLLERAGFSRLASMSSVFSRCTSLAQLDASSLSFSGVANAGGAFTNCFEFDEITIGPEFGDPSSLSALFDIADYWVAADGSSVECATPESMTEHARTAGSKTTFTAGFRSDTMRAIANKSTKALYLRAGTRPLAAGEELLGCYKESITPWDKIDYVHAFDKIVIENSVRTERAFAMFYEFRSVKSIEGLANLQTTGLANFARMFDGCMVLKEVDLSAFDTSSATNAADMFRDCYALKTIRLSAEVAFPVSVFPQGKWRSSADGVEYDADKIPYGVDSTYTLVEDDSGQSGGGDSGNSGQSGGGDGGQSDAGEDVRYALLKATGELVVTSVAPMVETGDELFKLPEYFYPHSSSDLPWHSRRQDITSVRIDSGKDVRSTAFWFSDCRNLARARIDGLASRSSLYMNDMFSGCAKLVSVDCSGLDAKSPFDCSRMFDGCSSLSAVKLPAGMRPYYLAAMFRDCSSLASIDLSGFSLGNKWCDLAEMFYNCSSLTELDLSTFDTSSAESLKRMLHGCRSLERVVLGANFSFRGSAFARLPGSELPSGAWQPAGVAGKSYASDSLPNFTAGAYVKVDENTPGLAVESLRGDTATGSTKYTVSTTVVEGDDGVLVAENDYVLADTYAADEFVVGELAKSSSTKTLSAKAVTQQTLRSVTANRNVHTVVIGPQVTRIAPSAFAQAPQVSNLKVKSAKLTTKSRMGNCLAGSRIAHVTISIADARARNAVANAFRNWAGKRAA